MNKLEKFFNTLHSTQSKVLKKFTTDELVSQIKEYVDFTPFICKNIYKLLISQNSEDRKNGAAILKSIMFQFRLITDFKIEYTKNKEEYLCSTGEEFVVKQISIREQAKLVKKMAELEHVEVSLVNEIDFKADTSFKIKKQKIKDKPIENIMDFFDNITANLLNYEWNKRHGAFLAFTSMFSESYDGDTEIKVDSSVFMKIYEILKNDKFNDFVDDKTTAPVREAAAELLACIYPRIPKNTIIDELFKFLEDEDWQTQYSGLIALNHLRDFIIKKEDLCLILEKMLIDTDEDVKYLSAQILKHFIKFCNLEEVASKCWDNIRNEEEIAVSKTSIISLLAEIHNINPAIIKIEDNINYLFPCFTSPIPEVRKSVLEMVKEINNESINFLIAETILLDENEEIRELAINILSKINNLGPNFINLFMKILSNSLYEPYSTDDFVSYDELAFTKSGVKLIGEDKILKNRVKLFMAIQKNLIKVEDKSNTAIGKIFYLINEHFYKSNPDDFDLEENNSIKNDNTKVDSTKVDNTKVDKVKRQKIQEDEDFLYKSFSDLRLVPLKELKSKIQNPFKSSIHPMGDPIFRDYLRLKAILDFPVLDLNTSLLFRFETCDEFLRLLSTLIIHKNPTNFIFEAFTLLVEGVDNFKIFFEVLGCRLLFDYSSVLSKINNSNSKIDFYSKTISFYSSEFDQLENLFYESYDKKAIRVLKGFIQNLKYAEKFVDLILKNFDLFLLSELIGDLDHSFYPLFVKKLLKIMHNNDQDVLSPSKILSFIVPRLTFNLNQNLNPIWLNRIEEAKNKLEALLNINKIPEYKSKCPTELILRNYQIEGVKWINFLFSFHLNGILADDMGLGKTIQVLYFICSEIYKTNKKVLILCPSSLTGHWKGEIEKFYPFIKCKIYKKLKNGNEKNGIANGKKDNGKKDNETINGKNQIETTNETTNINHNDSMDQILISSYDMFRNDYLNFIDKNWFYIILDEGHILRNSNTRLYNRVCQLKPTNKLVLTGTPVHNSVEDLISIFNFIMPKYLESSENIQISLKMSDQEVEKTYARLADLNKKILPFILRRLKIDVLKDLPPKIIRDITIEMGPIQQEVYNEINNNNNDNNVFINYKNIKNNAEGLKRTRDLLYASSHTSYFKKSYNEIPCKVKALEDIINLCGGEDIRNKILIFFQYKNTLEFVLEDIKLKFKMKILRLDGSVPSSKRSKIAQDFNEGNIPLLFLNTQIGGLGLNLTGADTVVFYEHDWNPFNDLQAMDRAHRIGQKKTVNVFRLITKGTLEERVMDLQSFKLFVASSLVSQQNADIETMDTKDLLERFS